MRYLILDKRQRVRTENENGIATASKRLLEELSLKNIDAELAFWDELEFEFRSGETKVKVKGVEIEKYSHIIYRSHNLHLPWEYEYKRYIIDYIDQYNSTHPEQKVLIQNSDAIKRLPYYNKISIAFFCSQHNIPYFNTYFQTGGNYTQPRDMLNSYPLIMKEYTGVNRLQMIDGEEKIKKNVFKIDSAQDFDQEYLRDEDKSRFFIQEFSNSGQDTRIFVKKGQVIGGWTRKATDGFMTVKGGEYQSYNTPTQEEKEIAESVAQILSSDFMAVDLMYMNGKPLVQEFSFHPGFKAYETKLEGEHINIAEAIITAF